MRPLSAFEQFRPGDIVPDIISTSEDLVRLAERRRIRMSTWKHALAMLVSGMPGDARGGIAQALTGAYVLLVVVLSIGWTMWHVRATLHNDEGLTGHRDLVRYPWYFDIAFICPQIDGLVNLAFAHYEVRCGLFQVGQYEGRSDGVQSETRKGYVWWLVSASAVLIALRLFFIAHGSVIVGFGSIIEFLPHVPTFFLLESQIDGMRAALDVLVDSVARAESPVSPEQCVDLYNIFYNYFVKSVSRRWQVLLCVSCLLEVYAGVFQAIWITLCEEPSQEKRLPYQATQISLLVIVQAMYVAFKFLPLALFNSHVLHFPHKIVVATAGRREDQRAAGITLGTLFLARPPTFKVLGIVIRRQLIATIMIGSVGSQGVRLISSLLASARH